MTFVSEDACAALHLQGLAHLYERDGQIQRSRLLLLIAYLLSPEDPAILENLASITLKASQPAVALRMIDQLERITPEQRPKSVSLRKQALWLTTRQNETFQS